MNSRGTHWTSERLGELAAGANAFVDGPFGSDLKASEYSDTGVPIVRIQNIRPNLFDFADQRFVPKHKADQLARHSYAPGDVIIAKMGDPCGVTCLVPEDAGQGIIVADVVRFRGDAKRIDHKYLSYFLNSTSGQAEFTRRSRGSTRNRVNLSEMKEVQIPLPPIEEQRLIAAILDKADDIRRKRRQALAQTDALLRAAYLELVSYKHSEYGTWPLVCIEELAAPRKGAMRTGPFGSDLRHSEFVDEGIAVLGIDNAVQNRFAWGERRFITEEKYGRLRRYRVYPDDVIITIMGTTGRSAVVPEDIPQAITTKHLATITPDRAKANPHFLSYAFHSDPHVIRQIKSANKGAIMPGLNLGIIKALEIRLPPLHLQERFATCVSKIHRHQDTWSSPELSGEALFSSLSQRAFRGEL